MEYHYVAIFQVFSNKVYQITKQDHVIGRQKPKNAALWIL